MTFNVSQIVTINGPAGGEIRITRDGSTPSPGSELYTDPLIIDRTTTLKAAVFGPPNEPSDVVSRPYVIMVATPIITPATSTFTAPILVSVTCATQGAVIRYTLDGSEPNEGSAQVLGPITIDSTKVLKARAFGAPKDPSLTATGTYTLETAGRVYFGYSPLTSLTESQLKAISNAPEPANYVDASDIFGDYGYGAGAGVSDYLYIWCPDTFSTPQPDIGFFDPSGFGPMSFAETSQGYTQGPINGWNHKALTVDGIPGKLRRTFYPVGSGARFVMRVQ